MYIKKIKKFLLGAATGLLAMLGTVTASFPAHAEQDIKAVYWIYDHEAGWSKETKDNRYVESPENSYATAIWASLENQPEGMTGTIEYQVNVSGFGWLKWQGHATEAGFSSGSRAVEAVKMRLTGEVGEQYDIYYSVLQHGEWTDFSMNGERSGIEGKGLRISGLRVAVRRKGAGEPAEPSAYGYVDPEKPMIALTYDDGPSVVTPLILDTLEANGARATFYMVGNRMNKHVSTIQRMRDLGCEFGNHTWNHIYLTSYSQSVIHSNLNQMDSNLQEIAGMRSTTVRPPGGFVNDSVRSALASYGVPAIMWSIDTLDWKTRNAQATIDTVLNQVRDGDIILMHDLYEATAAASAVLIPELINRGYQLVTVSELAAYRGGMQPGQSYHSFRK